MSESNARHARTGRVWVGAGIGLSGLGVAVCLFLTIGLGLTACPLCITQRTLVMGVFMVCTAGLALARTHPGTSCFLALPLAFAGLGVAGYHQYLVVAGILECPPGLLGMATLPAQSFALFALLTGTMIAGARGALAGRGAWSTPALVAAIGILGLLLAWGAVATSPPVPSRTTPYDPIQEPLANCRPAFR